MAKKPYGDPHPDNTHLLGRIILEVADRKPLLRDTTYRVLYPGCGCTRVQTHRYLAMARPAREQKCFVCLRREQQIETARNRKTSSQKWQERKQKRETQRTQADLFFQHWRVPA